MWEEDRESGRSLCELAKCAWRIFFPYILSISWHRLYKRKKNCSESAVWMIRNNYKQIINYKSVITVIIGRYTFSFLPHGTLWLQICSIWCPRDNSHPVFLLFCEKCRCGIRTITNADNSNCTCNRDMLHCNNFL